MATGTSSGDPGLGRLGNLPAEVRRMIFLHYFSGRKVAYGGDSSETSARCWRKEYPRALLETSRAVRKEALEAESNTPVHLEIENQDANPPPSLRRAARTLLNRNDNVTDNLWELIDNRRYPNVVEFGFEMPEHQIPTLEGLGGDFTDFFHCKMDQAVLNYMRECVRCREGEMPVKDPSSCPRGCIIRFYFSACGSIDDFRHVYMEIVVQDGKWKIKERYSPTGPEEDRLVFGSFNVTVGEDKQIRFS